MAKTLLANQLQFFAIIWCINGENVVFIWLPEQKCLYRRSKQVSDNFFTSGFFDSVWQSVLKINQFSWHQKWERRKSERASETQFFFHTTISKIAFCRNKNEIQYRASSCDHSFFFIVVIFFFFLYYEGRYNKKIN